MAITSVTVSVGTTPTLIVANTAGGAAPGDFDSREFRLKNSTATATVFLGDNTVATAGAPAGYPWAVADGAIVVRLEAGESLYGIVVTTAQSVVALGSGR